MLKIKFFFYDTSYSWNELCSEVNKLKYNDTDSQGLKILNCTASEISAIFYEKISYSETVNHPINGIIEEVNEVYFATEFVISNQYGMIYLLNPSKRAASFLTFFSFKLRSFQIAELEFDVLRFSETAKNIVDNYRTKKINFPPFQISQTGKAYFSISSKADAYGEVADINLPLPCKPSKIWFEGHSMGRKIAGEVSASGTCSLSEYNSSYLLEKFLDQHKNFVCQN